MGPDPPTPVHTEEAESFFSFLFLFLFIFLSLSFSSCLFFTLFVSPSLFLPFSHCSLKPDFCERHITSLCCKLRVGGSRMWIGHMTWLDTRSWLPEKLHDPNGVIWPFWGLTCDMKMLELDDQQVVHLDVLTLLWQKKVKGRSRNADDWLTQSITVLSFDSSRAYFSDYFPFDFPKRWNLSNLSFKFHPPRAQWVNISDFQDFNIIKF